VSGCSWRGISLKGTIHQPTVFGGGIDEDTGGGIAPQFTEAGLTEPCGSCSRTFLREME